VINFIPLPFYAWNEPLYPVKKKLFELQILYGYFGEKKNFLPFATDDA